MRIAIAAIGTRGDVQPMIALGRGLAAAGHEVTMIAGSNFADWIAAHGLRFVPSLDMEALMASEKGVAWAQSSDNPIVQLRAMRDLMRESGRAMIDPIHASTAWAELLVSSFSALPIVQTASEKSGIPYFNALLQPQHPTCSGAASLTPLLPTRDAAANRWMGIVTQRMVFWVAAETTNSYRAQLALTSHTSASFRHAIDQAPALMGFSRHVVPPARDWPQGAVPTGYWFLDEDSGWSPPHELRAFLEAGPAPVYVGFGSMSNREPSRTLDLILTAVKRAGQRAVIAAGWGDLPTGHLVPEACVVKSAPHQWLFPRVSALVHHGGAGTTAAGLRAGRPTLVVPHMSDQPYWGRRVHELGVGVRPLPRHKLTAEALAARLQELAEDGRVRERAAALGERIRAERGIEAAVAVIESAEHSRRRWLQSPTG